MKNAIKRTIAVLFAAGTLTSCSLEEWNPSAVDLETAYTQSVSWESLIDYCYDALYYFYGKIDGIGAMEMGTDLWASETYESGFTLYDGSLNTQQARLATVWNGFYACVNYCNTAIHFADMVQDATPEYLKTKLGEVYFLRGWSYWHIVEQFGGVVLSTESSAVAGVNNNPVRSTEAEIYDQIISDLKTAVDYLPVNQAEVGRASKKAALAMLAKAYLQRTRLNEPEANEYARLALETAKTLIDNAASYGCGLWESGTDAIGNEQSGYAKLWDGQNNKNNKEFLFVEHNDHQSSYNNPEGNNRGRTRQYYVMDLKTVGAMWGTAEKNCAWYSRANDRGFKPTKYLLTSVFEPVKDPADTRFKNTFHTEYYNSLWADYTIGENEVNIFKKDPSIIGHKIINTCGTYVPGNTYYKYYMDHTEIIGTAVIQHNSTGATGMVDEDKDGYLDGLSVFTPNYNIDAATKAKLPFLCVDPSDMFNSDGSWVTSTSSELGTYYKDCYPSFNKLSAVEYIVDNQKWVGNVPIIRLGDIYLIAAEAALLYNNDQATALKYVQPLRNRAAVKSREAAMAVSQGDMTLDFICAERARELAGEQWRWYDLKRMGKLTNAYLKQTNPDIKAFDENKHKIRPIPQSYLNAIANPDEFGSNGYL